MRLSVLKKSIGVRLYERTRSAVYIGSVEYSQEILLYKEPKELSLTIWIIVSLFVAALCWVIFGKMETVRSRGASFSA